MGAKAARVHDPSLSELDEGWGLDEVGPAQSSMRLVPETDSTPIASVDALADGWTLPSEHLSVFDQGHTDVRVASSGFSASEQAFFEMGDELAELASYEFSDEPPAAKRTWRWFRRSKR